MTDPLSRFVDGGRAAQAAADDAIATSTARAAHPETPAAHARRALEAAFHALRSYQYGNASPELARQVADECEAALKRLRRTR